MSTNIVAFLLLNKFRDGVSITELAEALDVIRNDLGLAGKDLGFTGDALDVIHYGVSICNKH